MSSQSSSTFSDEIDDGVLQDLYAWVDQIPLSRPKKNLTRDFSDGVLVAETIAHYFPKLVEIHNYPPATGTKLKMENWMVLNRKVFKKLHFELADEVIRQVTQCKPFVIERVLLMLRTKIDTILWEKQRGIAQSDKPEADQYNKETSRSKKEETGSTQRAANTKVPLVQYRHEPRSQRPQQPQQLNKMQTGGGDQLVRMSDRVVPDIPSDLVPRIQLEEKEQECLAKEETIQILQAKIRRLEHLVHLKDIRIEDLSHKMEGVRPTGKR